MEIQSKLPHVGTTIFTVMSQLALDHKAINLGQGFPDFNPDSKLIEHVHQAMLDGFNQYPAMAGVPELRHRIAGKIESLYGHTYDPDDEVTVTNGASEALMASILAFVHAGDEVIVIEPFYDLYLPCIELAGGKAVPVAMAPPQANAPQYQLDWDKIEQSISKRTRLLIINFPHNPTGVNLKDSDLDALQAIVEKHPILILSDEVYEHLTFDAKEHLSMARRPALAQRSIVVSSFGKTFHATGWKVGYCCAPGLLSQEIRKIHQFMVFTVATPLQVGLSRYMQDPGTYMKLAGFYQRKRDRLFAGLQQTRFKPLRSEGTFFLLADYSEISTVPEQDFATWLTREHGVGAIPVSAFYSQPHSRSANQNLVRFCFAKQDHTLDQALERLQKV